MYLATMIFCVTIEIMLVVLFSQSIGPSMGYFPCCSFTHSLCTTTATPPAREPSYSSVAGGLRLATQVTFSHIFCTKYSTSNRYQPFGYIDNLGHSATPTHPGLAVWLEILAQYRYWPGTWEFTWAFNVYCSYESSWYSRGI